MSTVASPIRSAPARGVKSPPIAFWGAVVGFLLALYWDVIPGMVRIWMEDPGYSHGVLVPPLALYVAWLHKDEIEAIPPGQDLRGVVLTAFGCLIYMIGRLGAEFFLTRISLVFVLAGIALTFWGAQRFSKLIFAFFLLATMVPIPAIIYNRLAAPLQLFASWVSAEALQLMGIPVFRDGNILNLAEIKLGVAEACSGLRSISSLTVLALVVGYFVNRKISIRALLFLLAFPTAIAANVLRIIVTALAARHDADLARGLFHSFSGWVVFLVGFIALYGMAMGLARLEGKGSDAAAEETAD